MIARKLKMILALGVVGILGGATPALAHGPRYDTRVDFVVGTPSWHVGFGYDAPRYAPSVNYRMLREGESLEAQGRALVAQGRDLEQRGRWLGYWRMVKRGERLESRGYQLIAQGRDLRARALVINPSGSRSPRPGTFG
ncbi:MAG: hypothetical protein U1F43_18000 [Myxococcota bacterium]